MRAETVENVFKWAERSCVLMKDAAFHLKTFEGLLLESKNPRGEHGSHHLIGMADCPEELQTAVLELLKHSNKCPENNLQHVANEIKNRVPEALSPIRCPEYYVLTALEASELWIAQLAKEMQAPLLWIGPVDNIFVAKAPNWASKSLSEDEFNDYERYLKLTRRKLRFANSDRIQWLMAMVEREKLIASINHDSNENEDESST